MIRYGHPFQSFTALPVYYWHWNVWKYQVLNKNKEENKREYCLYLLYYFIINKNYTKSEAKITTDKNPNPSLGAEETNIKD